MGNSTRIEKRRRAAILQASCHAAPLYTTETGRKLALPKLITKGEILAIASAGLDIFDVIGPTLDAAPE